MLIDKYLQGVKMNYMYLLGSTLTHYMGTGTQWVKSLQSQFSMSETGKLNKLTAQTAKGYF